MSRVRAALIPAVPGRRCPRASGGVIALPPAPARLLWSPLDGLLLPRGLLTADTIASDMNCGGTGFHWRFGTAARCPGGGADVTGGTGSLAAGRSIMIGRLAMT